MITNGGYLLLDLHNMTLSHVGTRIKGTYDILNQSPNKPVLLINVNVSGTNILSNSSYWAAKSYSSNGVALMFTAMRNLSVTSVVTLIIRPDDNVFAYVYEISSSVSNAQALDTVPTEEVQ